MNRPQATATQTIDDARVRVHRFDFEPGAETGWHRHEMDYVIVPVTRCEMLLEEPGGTSKTVTLEPGASYRRDVGVEHNVINAGSDVMSFVEIELK